MENILGSKRAINRPTPTKFESLIIKRFGQDFDKNNVQSFLENHIKEHNFYGSVSALAMKERWTPIQSIFFRRIEKIFGIRYPSSAVTAYLTHNQRFTYNIQDHYFFAKAQNIYSNNTIMHELMHFYTWHAFGKDLLDQSLSASTYNHFKESLTELLNLEFSDLMNNIPDHGYPQHLELRLKIRTLCLKDPSMSKLIETLIKELP